MPAHNAKDLTGQRFGKLTVMYRVVKGEGRKKQAYWYCVCDCGGESTPAGHTLTKENGVTSCGCNRSQTVAGESSKVALYARYRSDAKRRDISFELTEEQFLTLVVQECHYCGSSLQNKVDNKQLKGSFKYTGIDRINSDIGYREDNCIPCCKICNRAKNSMPYEEFMEWIHSLVQHNLEKMDEQSQTNIGGY